MLPLSSINAQPRVQAILKGEIGIRAWARCAAEGINRNSEPFPTRSIDRLRSLAIQWFKHVVVGGLSATTLCPATGFGRCCVVYFFSSGCDLLLLQLASAMRVRGGAWTGWAFLADDHWR